MVWGPLPPSPNSSNSSQRWWILGEGSQLAVNVGDNNVQFSQGAKCPKLSFITILGPFHHRYALFFYHPKANPSKVASVKDAVLEKDFISNTSGLGKSCIFPKIYAPYTVLLKQNEFWNGHLVFSILKKKKILYSKDIVKPTIVFEIKKKCHRRRRFLVFSWISRIQDLHFRNLFYFVFWRCLLALVSGPPYNLSLAIGPCGAMVRAVISKYSPARTFESRSGQLLR